MTLRLTLGFTLGLSLGLAACGGAPPPQDQLTASQAAIRAAEVAEAENVPRAKLHLKYARDQVAKAEALIQEGENEEARYILKRAEADADLALSLAKLESEQEEARKQLKRIEELQAGN